MADNQQEVLEEQILKAESDYKSEVRNSIIVATVVTAISLVIFFQPFDIQNHVWISIILGVIDAFFLLAFLGNKISDLKNEIAILKIKKRIYLGLPEKEEPTYFDSLVKINIENLAEYYLLVKKNTALSFNASLISGLIGFILILTGLIIGFNNNGGRQLNLTYISSSVGIITEFISAVLFYLYNKTVIQLKEYHNSLIDAQNVLLAFKLIEDTADEKIKTELMSKMIDALIKRT